MNPVSNIKLKAITEFCHLGSTQSNDTLIREGVENQLKAPVYPPESQLSGTNFTDSWAGHGNLSRENFKTKECRIHPSWILKR